ncbi:MAG: CsbD family protein [Deltaproteobacteria bacterium]|nr:CsbD family protein [Deltaproteobacteria bacterium]
MNWDTIEGNWKQLKGNVKEKWGKLTDDELDVIEGKKDRLAGKLQEKYGLAKVEVEKQMGEFQKTARIVNKSIRQGSQKLKKR